MVDAATDASARRVFEPERAYAGPAGDFCADDFSSREIGILCEQGNFERARLLLSRRALEPPLTADVVLDAVRMERSAAPGGAAWQAWVMRGLAEGARIAARLPALVPEDALRAYLVREAVGWSVLERQKDVAAARELLRLRLQSELDADPSAALACVEDPALIRSARTDPALMRLAVGVLAGTLWRLPERAGALAKELGVDVHETHGAETHPGDTRDAHALLAQARELHATWAALIEREPCPALDRFIRLGRLVGSERARVLLAALTADLRARPREYLRCAQAIADAPHRLASFLIAALQSVAHELHGLEAATGAPGPAATQVESALGERLQRCARAVAADPLQRLWVVALASTASALALVWLWSPALAALYAPVVLLLWPLRRSVDALLYRRHLRSALLDVIVADGWSTAELARHLAASPSRPLRRLAVRARGDGTLALLCEIARSGPVQPAPR